MNIINIDDHGYVIHGDSTRSAAVDAALQITDGAVPLIATDPPYGKTVNEDWDNTHSNDEDFSEWMVEWTEKWLRALKPGGAFYVWGGIGKPQFRPFFKYITKVEHRTKLQLANLITWSKKRAYGVDNNYLFTREELAMFINGDAKKPLCFNIPYLEAVRGYAGYNSKYPAKSEKYRRTNVWTDVNEIFRGKVHPTQKKQRVEEIPIEVHTQPGDWVIDPFAGSGTTAAAAIKLKRKFIVFEKEEKYIETIMKQIEIALTAPDSVSEEKEDE
jgi:site-specific DNA-methyltransferase (adenine-specific)